MTEWRGITVGELYKLINIDLDGKRHLPVPPTLAMVVSIDSYSYEELKGMAIVTLLEEGELRRRSTSGRYADGDGDECGFGHMTYKVVA